MTLVISPSVVWRLKVISLGLGLMVYPQMRLWSLPRVDLAEASMKREKT
jgi:hypothetical protein